jgi:hypothetical protein
MTEHGNIEESTYPIAHIGETVGAEVGMTGFEPAGPEPMRISSSKNMQNAAVVILHGRWKSR